ncbi:MAG TPA: sel1 repeat family protein [Acidobacteria bacterium]|jgi:TPR repeat protein|nr:sel1 repeat family protein [Acidobacteriota bacterium]
MRSIAQLLSVTVVLVTFSVPLASQQEFIDELRVLAEAKDAEAQVTLGLAYSFGRGVPQDDVEAVRWYRLAADQGDADGQVNLGLMYADGRGVPEDDPEAVRWIRLAADQGNGDAQLWLGLMYANGEGVPEDDVTAHMWFDLAASRFTGIDREGVVKSRDQLAAALTADQLAEAQRLAREWEAGHAPN